MALSMRPSSMVQTGQLLGNHPEVIAIMSDIDILLKTNEVLDKKRALLAKKMGGNSEKISGLFGKMKSIWRNGHVGSAEGLAEERENYADAMDEQESNDERQEQERNNYAEAMDRQEGSEEGKMKSLKEEEIFLVQETVESARNLADHEEELESLEMECGRNQNWLSLSHDVFKYRAMHKKFKDSRELRLKAIRNEVQRIEHLRAKKQLFSCNEGAEEESENYAMDGQEGRAERQEQERDNYDEAMVRQKGNNKIEKEEKEIVKRLKKKEKFLVQRIAESTRNLQDQENKLTSLEMEGGNDQAWYNQSQDVLMYRVMHKSYKERTELRLKMIQNKFNKIEHCSQSGSSWGSCGKKKVLKHVRAKLSCSSCHIKFHTMVAAMSHEKKHCQPNIFAQCGNAA
eukprot:GFUD01028610.1.p1 GENE.GFUD01028610.1~~GFUD01028610.1.p1  ORF type:complete len:400 (+),score=123.79 GFUD01028610.1:57-1256(+)